MAERDDIVVVAHESDSLTAEQVAAITEHARRWVGSPEGQARLREGQDQADRAIERLRRLRRVDPEDLRRHVTI